MDIKFKKQFPTRKELEIVSSTRIWKRQDKSARLIQRTFRDYVKYAPCVVVLKLGFVLIYTSWWLYYLRNICLGVTRKFYI